MGGKIIMEWKCNNCGAYNDGPGQFCVVCGTPHPAGGECVCPECQSVLQAFPGMRCPQCGHVLMEDLPPRPYPPVPPAPDPPDPGPGPAPKPNKAIVVIIVTALIVAGALAELFILKFFDADKKALNRTNEPVAATAATTVQATAPTAAPPASATSTSAPATAPATDPPTTAPATVPTTVPQTAPPTAPPATVPPTAPPQTQPPAQYAPSADAYIVRTRTGDGLYLRSGPGQNYPYILEMPNLSTVYYTGSQLNGFMSVDYIVNGRTYSGWASAGYLEAQSGSYPVSYVSYNTDGHYGINLRSGPTAQSTRLRILSEGTAVYRLGSTTGDYTLVRTTDGVQGWVMWKYLN